MADRSDWQDGARLRWLFLDLNSYFASVEQQLDPGLRGRPVIVAQVDSEHTCAIAASYEAKAFGVNTGTLVGEAKRLCPGLRVVPARHDIYVDYHHRIIAEIERHLPVAEVCSIDEVACALLGPERRVEQARALARRIKRGIREQVGVCLRASVGLAPSRLLAKIASDLKKPDGLTVLGADRLPGPLFDLALSDLPGIGVNMERRLRAAGIDSVAAFWRLSPSRARRAWGGITGEGFWYGLHGVDPPRAATRRGSISHSQVLAPDLRRPDLAYLVARRLLVKAASRLRRMDYRAGALTLAMRLENRRRCAAERRLVATTDSFALLQGLGALWGELRPQIGTCRVLKVGVALHRLAAAETTPDLFGWSAAAAEDPRSRRLCEAIDRLNQRYGQDSVTIGLAPGMRHGVGAKVAFNHIPDRAAFRE